MEKLDRLAMVLGAVLEPRPLVSTVPKALSKGRPKKKGPTMKTDTECDLLQEDANAYAKEANEQHFEIRQGVWYLGDTQGAFIFNNNPYEADPFERQKQMERVARRLKKIGITVLAKGGYGELIRGANEPYTTGMLVDADEESMGEITRICQEEMGKSNSHILQLATRKEVKRREKK